jgi:PAS domain S-box-containing protein
MSELRPPFGASPDLSEMRDRLAGVNAIWERDLESETVHWDGNLESHLGYCRDEVRTTSAGGAGACIRMISRAWSRLRRKRLAATPPGGRASRFRRKDGSSAWVASRCAIERDAKGRARRAVGAMIDISKLKETESRLLLFTEQIPARACATDHELRVVWDAGAASAANASVVGKTVPELFAQSQTASACWRGAPGRSQASRTDSISTAGPRPRTCTSRRSAIRPGT